MLNKHLRSALFVLVVRVGTAVEQELGTVGVTESHRVKQCRATVRVDKVHFGTAESHEGLEAVAVAAARRTVQS